MASGRSTGRLAAPLVLVLVLVLAACSGGSDSAEPAPAFDAATDADGGADESATSTTTSAITATDGATADDSTTDKAAVAEGMPITVLGTVPIEEAADIAQALAEFGAAEGLSIEFAAVGNVMAEIAARRGTDAGVVALVERPRDLVDLVRSGDARPIPTAVQSMWPATFDPIGVMDGNRFAMPSSIRVESLVWYRADLFDERGYEIPETWDDFKTQATAMIENGDTPLCIGGDDDAATPEVFHDWVEDLFIRYLGPGFVDQWVDHGVPYDQPEIKDVWAEVFELWTIPGMVHRPDEPAGASTTADDLLAGRCLMAKRPSTPLGDIDPAGADQDEAADSAAEIGFFYLPTVKGDRPVTVEITQVAAFTDEPAAWSVVEFLTSSTYADRRHELAAGTEQEGRFLSAASGQDRFGLPSEAADILAIVEAADAVRVDATDVMPTALGPLLDEAVTDVISGRRSIADATLAVELAWPE